MSCEALWCTQRHAEDDRHAWQARLHTHTHKQAYEHGCRKVKVRVTFIFRQLHTHTRTSNTPRRSAANFLQLEKKKKGWHKYNHTHTYTINTFRSLGSFMSSLSQSAKHVYTQRTLCSSGEGWQDMQAERNKKEENMGSGVRTRREK